MSQWWTEELPCVLDFREGPGILAKDFREHGVPLIRLAGLKRDASLLSGCNYLDPGDVARRWKQFQVKEGDVLLSTSASLGEVAVVPHSAVGGVPYTGIIRFRPRNGRIDPMFIPHMLTAPTFKRQIAAMGVGSVMKHFGPTHLRAMKVTFPTRPEQRAIAEVLGALDDKIAANRRISDSAAALAASFFSEATLGASVEARLADVAELVTRGITPSYTEDGSGVVVLNQKCVRHHRILTEQARLTSPAKTRAEKMLRRNDVLINSTGQGTLGRTARWTLDIDSTVDSHVTIVRFDKEKVDPVCGGHAVLAAEPRIEALGEGSTGQTELSRAMVSDLRIRLPARDRQQDLSEKLDGLERLGVQCLDECEYLARTRDALLLLLMSGKVRVKDVEDQVGEMV